MGPCAIAIGGNQGRRHLGLFYRDPIRKTSFLLHLTTGTLRDDPSGAGHRYLWGIPSLPVHRQTDLVVKAILVKVRNMQGRIPYGFSLPDGFFDRNTGEMLLGPGKVGLTCATFILALFHMIGKQLIDYDTYTERPGDKQEQDFLIDNLRKNGFDAQYISEVEKQANGVRFRPEEVMAAALIPTDNNAMNYLMPLGEDVVNRILGISV